MWKCFSSGPWSLLVFAIIMYIAAILALIGAVRNSSGLWLLLSAFQLVAGTIHLTRFFRKRDGEDE